MFNVSETQCRMRSTPVTAPHLRWKDQRSRVRKRISKDLRSRVWSDNKFVNLMPRRWRWNIESSLWVCSDVPSCFTSNITQKLTGSESDSPIVTPYPNETSHETLYLGHFFLSNLRNLVSISLRVRISHTKTINGWMWFQKITTLHDIGA